MKPGDEVVVTRADNSEVVYGATPGATLRLITCGGSFDRSARHYRDNLIAFATFKA